MTGSRFRGSWKQPTRGGRCRWAVGRGIQTGTAVSIYSMMTPRDQTSGYGDSYCCQIREYEPAIRLLIIYGARHSGSTNQVPFSPGAMSASSALRTGSLLTSTSRPCTTILEQVAAVSQSPTLTSLSPSRYRLSRVSLLQRALPRIALMALTMHSRTILSYSQLLANSSEWWLVGAILNNSTEGSLCCLVILNRCCRRVSHDSHHSNGELQFLALILGRGHHICLGPSIAILCRALCICSPWVLDFISLIFIFWGCCFRFMPATMNSLQNLFSYTPVITHSVPRLLSLSYSYFVRSEVWSRLFLAGESKLQPESIALEDGELYLPLRFQQQVVILAFTLLLSSKCRSLLGAVTRDCYYYLPGLWSLPSLLMLSISWRVPTKPRLVMCSVRCFLRDCSLTLWQVWANWNTFSVREAGLQARARCSSGLRVRPAVLALLFVALSFCRSCWVYSFLPEMFFSLLFMTVLMNLGLPGMSAQCNYFFFPLHMQESTTA